MPKGVHQLKIEDIAAIDAWSDEEAERLVIDLRWPNGPVCVNCGGADVEIKPTLNLECKTCGRTFNVKGETIFSKSAIGWRRIASMARSFVLNGGLRDGFKVVGRRLMLAAEMSPCGNSRVGCRRYAAMMAYAQIRGHIHISPTWIDNHNALALVGYSEGAEDEKSEAAKVVNETRAFISATQPPLLPRVLEIANADERAGRELERAMTTKNYRFGASSRLSGDDLDAIDKFLRENPITVARTQVPKRYKKRAAPKPAPAKSQINGRYAPSAREKGAALAQEAAEWCVETGMTVREACAKTGASAQLTSNALKEMRAKGANMTLYDLSVVQQRGAGGATTARNRKLKQLEKAREGIKQKPSED